MDKAYHFSAPGRTELGGNHTDHQGGCVLAAAVDLETAAQVRRNGRDVIRMDSEGYEPVEVNLLDLSVRPEEKNTAAALVRGVAAAFVQRGYPLSGLDIKVRSTVLPGSGLSSSAAFEVLLGRILNALFAGGTISPTEIAQIGQYAENVYYGKPSGLMDQLTSSVGGLVFMDFSDSKQPRAERLDYDFSRSGYALCIVDCGAGHAGLTEEYAALPREMGAVARFFGKEVLRDVEEEEFYRRLPELRRQVGDRAVLRSIHFFDENRRVLRQRKALQEGDFEAFLRHVRVSGCSSWTLAQNVIPAGQVQRQEMAVAIALCRRLLSGRGAVRVHGGGFAGTALAFVPEEDFAAFQAQVEAALTPGSCRRLEVK